MSTPAECSHFAERTWAMKKKSKKSDSRMIWLASGIFVALLLFAGTLAAYYLVSENEGKRQRHVQMVTLLKPPPPPKIEEKPPEPEVKKEMKKEEMIEPEAKAPQPKQPDNSPPPGKNLGVDAEGGAGSDGFGLVGNRGGAALIGGGGGSLMGRYAWYAQIIQDQIKRDLLQRLQRKGGIPKGKIQAVVRIVMNDKGNIVKYQILDSSGNKLVEEAVTETLSRTTINRPPPEGMPLRMKLKITAQG